MLSNVLDTKGEGVGGGIFFISPSHGGGHFGNLGAKFRFLCIIKFKLTSIIADENV